MVASQRDAVIDYACTYAEKLKQLYMTISEKFTADRAFWQTLADEQTQHLQWLQQIRRLCASNILVLDASRIHVGAIESAVPYMEVVKSRIGKNQWPYSEIIGEVRDFEQNLMDCGLVAALHTAGGDEHAMIQQLSLGIEQHRDRLLSKQRDSQREASPRPSLK